VEAGVDGLGDEQVGFADHHGLEGAARLAGPKRRLRLGRVMTDEPTGRPVSMSHDVDLVLDTVGGTDSSRLLRTLKRGGAVFPAFVVACDSEEVARLGVTTSGTQVRSNGAQLAELGRLLAADRLRVEVYSTFPLSEARQAHEHAARGHLKGKTVLAVP
jgi:NADPH:quinone reductase-like Zn-dependent oxidoreductase